MNYMVSKHPYNVTLTAASISTLAALAVPSERAAEPEQ